MTGERNAGRKVDTRLLELLACPLTKGPLKWDAEHGELVSRLARPFCKPRSPTLSLRSRKVSCA
ncbi:MAG: hypothetical protein J0H89_12270 [Rhizobiales bacterium]|nr:hypothetical protein [Hyphomicrobiales bacterium]